MSLSASSGYPRNFSPWCSPARLVLQRLVMAFHKYHRWLSFLQMRYFLPGTEDYPVEENECEHVIWEKRNNWKYMVRSGLFKSYLITRIHYFDIFNKLFKVRPFWSATHLNQRVIWGPNPLFNNRVNQSRQAHKQLGAALKSQSFHHEVTQDQLYHFLVSALGNSQTILQLAC